ncbi:hypothetical protein ACO0LB_03255 [Undibacterium sp. SXout7W]
MMFPRLLLRNVLLAIVLIAVLVVAFMAYLQPAFIVDLANRFVMC